VLDQTIGRAGELCHGLQMQRAGVAIDGKWNEGDIVGQRDGLKDMRPQGTKKDERAFRKIALHIQPTPSKTNPEPPTTSITQPIIRLSADPSLKTKFATSNMSLARSKDQRINKSHLLIPPHHHDHHYHHHNLIPQSWQADSPLSAHTASSSASSTPTSDLPPPASSPHSPPSACPALGTGSAEIASAGRFAGQALEGGGSTASLASRSTCWGRHWFVACLGQDCRLPWLELWHLREISHSARTWQELQPAWTQTPASPNPRIPSSGSSAVSRLVAQAATSESLHPCQSSYHSDSPTPWAPYSSSCDGHLVEQWHCRQYTQPRPAICFRARNCIEVSLVIHNARR